MTAKTDKKLSKGQLAYEQERARKAGKSLEEWMKDKGQGRGGSGEESRAESREETGSVQPPTRPRPQADLGASPRSYGCEAGGSI